jgi:hypothetical protein
MAECIAGRADDLQRAPRPCNGNAEHFFRIVTARQVTSFVHRMEERHLGSPSEVTVMRSIRKRLAALVVMLALPAAAALAPVVVHGQTARPHADPGEHVNYCCIPAAEVLPPGVPDELHEPAGHLQLDLAQHRPEGRVSQVEGRPLLRRWVRLRETRTSTAARGRSAPIAPGRS